jgi:DNA-binding NarL/FixJ family response regulator
MSGSSHRKQQVDQRTVGSLRAAVLSDYVTIRRGLQTLVEEQGVEVALETPPSSVVGSQLTTSGCDLAILDIGTTGAEQAVHVCDELVTEANQLPVIGVQCCGPNPPQVNRYVGAGMKSVVSISQDEAPLREALSALARGEGVIHIRGRRLAETLRRSPLLSDLDLAILSCKMRGLSDEKAGAQVGLHGTSVKRRLEKLAKDNGLTDRFQLGAWAMHWGLVTLPGEDESLG